MKSPTTGVLLAIALAGCGVWMPTPPEPWPIDPAAITDPARMAVEPAAAAPGDVVALHFPGGHDRGVAFAIDASVAGEWVRQALLISDANGGQPRWFPIDDERAMVEMVGIGGEGPDIVPVPDGLPPGDYRICTANAIENLCAPFEVTAP